MGNFLFGYIIGRGGGEGRGSAGEVIVALTAVAMFLFGTMYVPVIFGRLFAHITGLPWLFIPSLIAILAATTYLAIFAVGLSNIMAIMFWAIISAIVFLIGVAMQDRLLLATFPDAGTIIQGRMLESFPSSHIFGTTMFMLSQVGLTFSLKLLAWAKFDNPRERRLFTRPKRSS